jgi:hypothetical protein
MLSYELNIQISFDAAEIALLNCMNSITNREKEVVFVIKTANRTDDE